MPQSDAVYTSGLSGKGALLEETHLVLAQVDAGLGIDEIRAQVLEDDLLQKTTRSTRESVWKKIYSRYLTDSAGIAALARLVTHSQNYATSRLALFYEFCRSERLLRDTTLHCIWPRYQAGFSGVSKVDVQTFFDELTPHHPELGAWTPQTRDKVVSNILSILRDFGLLEGAQRKTFARLYVPPAAFVYVLYRLRDGGLTTAPEVVAAQDWHLFFLEHEDVVALLKEASLQGHCTFKHQANVMDLAWTYSTLEACVEALTGKV